MCMIMLGINGLDLFSTLHLEDFKGKCKRRSPYAGILETFFFMIFFNIISIDKTVISLIMYAKIVPG